MYGTSPYYAGDGKRALPLLILFPCIVVTIVIISIALSQRHQPAPPASTGEALPQQLDLGSIDAGLDMDFQVTLCPVRQDEWPVATNERQLSNTIMSAGLDNPLDPRGLNALLVGFGQFMDHELVLSRQDTDLPPIVLAFNEQIDMSINHFARRVNAKNGRNEPETHRSPYIDGSPVYGDAYSSAEELARIRLPGSCKLRTSHGGSCLPIDEELGNAFYAGDPRNSEQALLHVIHVLFVREHNRLCDVLDARPDTADWSAEQKFYKAREIVIAKEQHIVYEEWLPALFGAQIGLLSAVPMRHNSARIATEFAVSAGRFHTMVPNMVGAFNLTELFFTYNLMTSVGAEPILAALATTPAARADIFIVEGLRNFLFGSFGMDLAAINLMRGRELHLGTYQQIAKCYGASSVPTVHHDVYLGILGEPLLPGCSLPGTMAIMVAEQYRRLREYDPNFYTTNFTERFGEAFQTEILSTTLRSLILQHYPGLELPPRSFFV